jgi:hypothetical protein
MPACPVCRDEFTDGVSICPTDGEALVATEDLPPRPVGEAPLGLFHPSVVLVVQRFLGARDVQWRTVEVDDERVQLWVTEDVRDDLRAALVMTWPGLLRVLDAEFQQQLRALGGDHPGWHDAPHGAWVDDHGRIRVEATPDEEAAADAARTVGPGLAIVGIVLLLLAWVNGWDGGPVVLGIGAIVLGLLLPR